jgi:hypothetical protein
MALLMFGDECERETGGFTFTSIPLLSNARPVARNRLRGCVIAVYKGMTHA